MYWVSIYSVQKEKVVGEAAHQQLKAKKKKKKKNMARRNPSGKSIIGDHACNDKSLGN